jgi:predicted transcriptional regulator
MSEPVNPLPREMGRRIVRPATAEEAQRHATVRRAIEEELPEIKEWARQAVAECDNRVAVGTVFSADEKPVVEAIDAYAASHSLPNRSAVIREALAHLLNLRISHEAPGS